MWVTDTFSPLDLESSFSLFFIAVMNSTKMASLSFILSMFLNRWSLPCFIANSLNVVLKGKEKTNQNKKKNHLTTSTHKSSYKTLIYLGVSLASSIILLNSSLACISLFFFSFLSSSARVFTYWSNTWNKKLTFWLDRPWLDEWTWLWLRRECTNVPVSSLLDWVGGNGDQRQSYEVLCPKLRRQTPVWKTQRSRSCDGLL